MAFYLTQALLSNISHSILIKVHRSEHPHLFCTFQENTVLLYTHKHLFDVKYETQEKISVKKQC